MNGGNGMSDTEAMHVAGAAAEVDNEDASVGSPPTTTATTKDLALPAATGLPEPPPPPTVQRVMLRPEDLERELRGRSPEELAELRRQAKAGYEQMAAAIDAASAPARTSAVQEISAADAGEVRAQMPGRSRVMPRSSTSAVYEPPVDPKRLTQTPMAHLRPLFYHWTLEAIRATAYEHEIAPGKTETRYDSIDGILVRRLQEPLPDGPPDLIPPTDLIIFLFEKATAADIQGNILQVPEGSYLAARCNHSTRELVAVLKKAISKGGRPHVRITPMRFVTLADGREEIFCDCQVQPDDRDQREMFIITDQSVNPRIGDVLK